MARSKEALERRAEKRQISVEEQRLKDRKSKPKEPLKEDVTSNEHKRPTDAKKAISGVKRKAEKIEETNNTEWLCHKCSNKNYAHRSTCNRCMETRMDTGANVKTAPKVVHNAGNVAIRTDDSAVATSQGKPSVKTTNSLQWTCTSCQNENFPHRTHCNRCMTERVICIKADSKGSISNESIQPVVQKSESTSSSYITSNKKPKFASTTAVGKQQVKTKSTWSAPADDKRIAENEALRIAYLAGKVEGLTPENVERAKILVQRSQRKKEKKVKLNRWKEKKAKKSNSNKGKVVKASGASVNKM
jgi:uncharacterized OB-fold protein